MKRVVALLLAVGLLWGATTAQAVDFNAKGQWIFGFGVVDSSFVKNPGSRKSGVSGQDTFDARQRVKVQIDAVASEALSGTIYFEMGDQKWGHAGSGGALGADGKVVEVKHAYIDWLVPRTELRLRMGLQAVNLPNAAGGSALFADDVAGITASYRINENVAVTALWGRIYNDNFNGDEEGFRGPAGYLDNMDMVSVAVPITLDGWKITPWGLASFTGKNVVPGLFGRTLPFPYPAAGLGTAGFDTDTLNTGGLSYSSAYWVGLPIEISALDPWRFEFDFNYGWSEGFGRYDAVSAKGDARRASSRREGWLVKGLAEYSMDWGTPGVFAWYGSGDQGVSDGSGRMPYLDGWGSFGSFTSDGVYAWSLGGGGSRSSGYEISSMYTGTWGVGVQLKNMSFMEDLKHTFRVSYWGGTNSPSMIKYMADGNGVRSKGWDQIGDSVLYLTTGDSLVEFNVDSTYKIYENLEATLELGYIVNGIDADQWKKYDGGASRSWQKADAYKAALIFQYSF